MLKGMESGSMSGQLWVEDVYGRAPVYLKEPFDMYPFYLSEPCNSTGQHKRAHSYLYSSWNELLQFNKCLISLVFGSLVVMYLLVIEL